MRSLIPSALLALLTLATSSATAEDRRLACENFAELAATVIQIRQQEPEVTRVLNYADTNLRDQYPPHVFSLVKQMIQEAFARNPVSPSSLENEVRTFAENQRIGCNNLYAQLDP
jgi:hypothetical protein